MDLEDNAIDKLQHLIVWLCMHNALPTNQLCHRCHMVNSPFYDRSTIGALEDILHCLRDCSISMQVWQHFHFIDNCVFWEIPQFSELDRKYGEKQSSLHVCCDSMVGLALGITLGSFTMWSYKLTGCIWTSTISAIRLSRKKNERDSKGGLQNKDFVKLNVDGSCTSNGDIGSHGLISDEDDN